MQNYIKIIHMCWKDQNVPCSSVNMIAFYKHLSGFSFFSRITYLPYLAIMSLHTCDFIKLIYIAEDSITLRHTEFHDKNIIIYLIFLLNITNNVNFEEIWYRQYSQTRLLCFLKDFFLYLLIFNHLYIVLSCKYELHVYKCIYLYVSC